MFPHLSGFRVNVSLLQEAVNKELIAILDRCDGTKAIVWDDSLSGPMGLVTKYTFLKERNVTKMLPLRPGVLPPVDVKYIIFITRPNLKQIEYIAENVHSLEKRQKGSIRKELFLYFLPRKSTLCENQLKNKGVYGSFTIVDELKCDFFPVDNDLLSMELKDAYKELHIEGDPTSIHMSATALVSLQKLYGRIPKIYGKGTNAQKVCELMKKIGREELMCAGSGKGSIDQLIILDRSVDLMSTLATQLTYEGLIDENFGINQSTTHFPAEKFEKSEEEFNPPVTTDKQTIILNSGEELYTELRDQNFNAVGQILTRHVKSISQHFDELHKNTSVQDLKRFVLERMPSMMNRRKSVTQHTIIAELIREITSSDKFLDELDCEQEFLVCSDIDKPNVFIENLMAKKAPLRTVIRLMCMQSIAGGGLKQKILDYYKRELVHVYGIQVLLALGQLERAGLFKAQTGSRTYTVLRKTMNLTVDDAIEVAPRDISYVHTFYAPLTIRIVEQLIKPNGFQILRDLLAQMPEPLFEEYQSAVQPSNASNRRGSFSSEISASEVTKVILVFFLGGCTFAEISALRFLSKQEDLNYSRNVEFVIATTKIINKNTFLDSFITI